MLRKLILLAVLLTTLAGTSSADMADDSWVVYAGFVLDKLRFGSRAERDYGLFKEEARAYAALLSTQDHPELVLDRVSQIINLQEKISYNTILCILLMQIYSALLRCNLKRRQVNPDRCLTVTRVPR